MGLARRSIRLLLPQAHRRFVDDFTLAMLDDGPVRPPKSPKPTSQLAVQFEFRFFPRSPKHKKAQQGLGTASCEWDIGGFGVTGKVRAKDQAPVPGSIPTWRVGLKESQSS